MIERACPSPTPWPTAPTIQRAGDKGHRGVGLSQVLAYVAEFRKKDQTTPVVLMGYANPLERYDQIYGEDAFVSHAAAAGVDGVLIVDYPPEECEEFAAKLKARDMDLIFLLAPTSTRTHANQVARVANWPSRLLSSRSRA